MDAQFFMYLVIALFVLSFFFKKTQKPIACTLHKWKYEKQSGSGSESEFLKCEKCGYLPNLDITE